MLLLLPLGPEFNGLYNCRDKSLILKAKNYSLLRGTTPWNKWENPCRENEGEEWAVESERATADSTKDKATS